MQRKIVPVTVALVILALAFPPLVVPVWGADQTLPSSSACIRQVEQQIQLSNASPDQSIAVALALSSSSLQNVSAGYVVQFTSISNEWSYDSNCNVAWTAVDVDFLLTSLTGSQLSASVQEDTSLTRVLGVQIVPALSASVPAPGYSQTWSGYELQGSATPTTVVYEAYAYWSVTGISAPDTGAGNCATANGCTLLTWDGIAKPTGGYAGNNTGQLIQGGSATTVYGKCTPGCTIYKWVTYAWWEELPDYGTVQTCSISVSTGDQVSPDIYNANVGGGSNKYYIYVYDTTRATVCTPSPNPITDNHMAYTYFAEFQIERGVNRLVGATTLPRFNTFTISGEMSYVGRLHDIYDAYSQGWGTKIQMRNSGVNNTWIGPVTYGSGFGPFTEKYITSRNT